MNKKNLVGSLVTASAVTLLAGSALAGNGALLGVGTGYPLINFNTGTSPSATYNGTTLSITGIPVFVTFTSGGPAEFVTPGGLTINANIDAAGIFSSGTFSISGSVTDTKGTGSTGDDVSYGGILLSGSVANYGIVDLGAADLADFLMDATGGSMLARVGGSGADIGASVTLEGSTFAGTFDSNWSAVVTKGDIGPPGTGFCQFANPALGDAGLCTVFQMGAAKVSMSNGDPTGDFGNLCMSDNSSLSMSGGQVVLGDAYLGSPVSVSMSGTTQIVGQVIQPFDLTAQRNAALTTSADKAALSCDQNVGALTTAGTITATKDGENVICASKITLNKTVTLADGGYNGVSFVINVTGDFKLSGGPGGQIRTQAPLAPQNVLINVLGTGADVKTSGGGNVSIVDGTILAPYRKIGLAPGRVNGQVMSTKDITLSSGAIVECVVPTFSPPEQP